MWRKMSPSIYLTWNWNKITKLKITSSAHTKPEIMCLISHVILRSLNLFFSSAYPFNKQNDLWLGLFFALFACSHATEINLCYVNNYGPLTKQQKKKWMSVISLRLERILGWFSMASFTVAHALIPHQIDNIDAQQNFSIYLLLYSVYLLVVYFFLLSFRPWFVHTSGGLVVYALAHLYMRFRSYTLYVSFSHSYHSWWIFF